MVRVTMPYAEKAKQKVAVAKANRKWRQRMKHDPEWLEKERIRKAAWYAANKEKKAEAQRRYRARKRLG